ncbi:hypothetical protein B0H19DRAFT_1375392 [Mycena capillaripes]|nr:hypothetical protein B0H19DRAFT_1375392 [Mycena capillaripes]
MEGMQPVILCVPVEILLEITAYYHNTTLPYERYPRATADKILLGRFKVLHALSQTCRYFRKIFAALVWEQLELVDNTPEHSKVLTKKITGILKTPSLPRCLRTLLVSLTFPSQNHWNLLTLFVRFLAAAPHLTSLHIIDISERHASFLSDLTESQSLLSVQILTIPCSLSRTMSSFPNIHSLICADTVVSAYDSAALLKAASKHCPSLEALINFLPSPPVVKCLLKHFPLIKTLRFRHVLSSDVLGLLADLQNLQSIRFPYRYQHHGETLEQICEAAKMIFQGEMPIQVQYLTPEADIGEVVVRVGIVLS